MSPSLSRLTIRMRIVGLPVSSRRSWTGIIALHDAEMKILVVRRDNIGDLVCTTPLFSALRRNHPDAWIGALVNSYNAPVLDRNPHLDAVISYSKLKHLAEGESIVGAFGRRIASFWKLRQL